MKTVSRKLRLELTFLLAALACIPMRGAVSVSPEELGEASQWVAAKFKGVAAAERPAVGLRVLASTQPPFSFKYGERPSSEFLGQWKLERQSQKLDEQRDQHTLTWTDSQSGLCVRCVGVQYHDYPTVEWTVYFKNTGTADSPIIEDIQAIDTTFSSGAQGDCILRHHTGDLCTPDSYQPHADPLPTRS